MNTEITIRFQDSERPTQQPSFPLNFEGHNIRYAIIDGEPWFAAVDVCNALGLSNPTMALKKLDDDEVQVIDISTLSLIEGIKNQQLRKSPNSSINVISEPGVYGLTFTSRKPEAKRFKRWLKHEVLPTIRKTGKYELPPAQPETITDEQYNMVFHALNKAVRGSLDESSDRHTLQNYLKCKFNADPLTKLKFKDLQPALAYLESASSKLFEIRCQLREDGKYAVKHLVAGSMPSIRHLKGRHRRNLEEKFGRPVDAHEILVFDYVEKNGLKLVEA